MNFLVSQFGNLQLSTSDISLISHAHGRERRKSRNIDKRELQAAIKHGRREKAAPDKNGEIRWKYIYGGVAYITDATSRHEITSWRLDEDLDGIQQNPVASDCDISSHTIIVVDCSGSMRKSDCPGYPSRTKCTYECLIKDFVQPQIELQKNKSAGRIGTAVVSLIEMSDNANVLLERTPIDNNLVESLRSRGDVWARSHGNYIPALDKLTQLVMQEQSSTAQFFVVFMSDGAPSDHIERRCEHGIQVWQEDGTGRQWRGKHMLKVCPVNERDCRINVQKVVVTEILSMVRYLGDMVGRDRIRFHSVAFGDPKDDFVVLQQMANVLPRNSFQKMGLSGALLSTAFTTLSSSLTTLRTESSSPHGPRTLRQIGKEEKTDSSTSSAAPVSSEGGELLFEWAGWHIYFLSSRDRISLRTKQKYDFLSRCFINVPLTRGATGVAVKSKYFSKGVERAAFRCSECKPTSGFSNSAEAVGPRLVAKESLHLEALTDALFHKKMCELQALASFYADAFNREVSAVFGVSQEWILSFIDCYIYEVADYRYDIGKAWILGEVELEGKFMKWNNNNGKILEPPRVSRKAAVQSSLGAIAEDDEEEDEEGDEKEDQFVAGGQSFNFFTDIPQCFSHYTYHKSARTSLVCDLQGVWNEYDGFRFTDPVVHSAGAGHRNGPTDKGTKGIDNFFTTHVCSSLCRVLRLRHPNA